jgi:hypothetical protein
MKKAGPFGILMDLAPPFPNVRAPNLESEYIKIPSFGP